MATLRSKPPRLHGSGNGADYTLGDALAVCLFRSIVGLSGIDILGRRPTAAIAAHEPGLGDPLPGVLAELAEVVRTGGTVLVMARERADRDRIKALLTGMCRSPAGRA